VEIKIVVDTNIIFSALLSSSSNIRQIITSQTFDLFSCNSAITELLSLKSKILKYTKFETEKLEYLMHQIIKEIEFINERYISKEAYQKAWQLCKEIDESDTPFVALAIELKALLWTGDKKLFKGLKEKGFEDVISTQELMIKVGYEI